MGDNRYPHRPDERMPAEPDGLAVTAFDAIAAGRVSVRFGEEDPKSGIEFYLLFVHY